MSRKEEKNRKSKSSGKYEGMFTFSEYRNNEEFRKKVSSHPSAGRRKSGSGITASNRKRLAGGFAFLLILMSVLIFRMGYWQIIKADELQEKAVAAQTADTEIDPVRGTIYDANMSTLAETVTEYELYGYTQYMYKDDELTDAEKKNAVSNLVEITGLSESEITEKLSGDENLVLIADGLSNEQIEKAQEIWDTDVVVKTKAARYYPNGSFAANVLGGVDSDNVGRVGLEYEYNSVLAGVKGRTIRTTDRDGNTVAGGSTKFYEAQDGNSIVTSIDSVIQHFVEDAIKTGYDRTGAEKVTCIVTNPKTGDVLALASYPSYDPNNSDRPMSDSEYESFKKLSTEEQSEYLSKMWTVDAVSSIYEPGSTFKLITAASALESGSADMDSTYYCNGAIQVDNYTLHCLASHGTQNLEEAVGNSCNPALAQVALDMGAKTFYNYIDLFGFRDQTGIDLPGEADSIVKDPADMGDVDLATTGYGQGIAISPIQILCAVNAFGNDGVIMKPKLVKKIIDSDGNTVKEVEDTEVRQAVSKETADKMCEIMEYYVEEAGGDEAYVSGYRIGGKTGTANYVSGGEYSSGTNTSFVAMAPMDDPQISMIVIVYKPTKVQYGNNTAGPVIKEIMEKSLQYLGVEREYSEDEEDTSTKDMITVPDVTGKNSDKAVAALKKAKLSYTFVPESNTDTSFVVVDQYPKAGTKVEKNSKVYLYSE